MNINWLFLLIALLAGIAVFGLWYRLTAWPRLVGGVLAIGVAATVFFLLSYYMGVELRVSQFNKNLQKASPIFSIIAEQHPKVYESFLAQVKEAYHEHAVSSDLEELTFNLMNQMFPSYLAKAPDESIYAVLEATLDLYELIYTDYPVLVLRLEFPERFTDVPISRLDAPMYKAALNKMREAKFALVKAAIQDPQPMPDSDAVESKIAQIINDLISEDGETVVANTFNGKDDPNLNKKMAASVIIAFYRQLLAQLPEGAGEIIRYFSQPTSASK